MFSQLFQLQERFDEDPSIVNYVALRRFAPGCDTEVFLFAGLDPFGVLGQELEKVGLNRVLVSGALGGNDRDIDELCLQLLERLIERKRLEAMGANASAKSRQVHFRRPRELLDRFDGRGSSARWHGAKTIPRLARSRTARWGKHRNL